MFEYNRCFIIDTGAMMSGIVQTQSAGQLRKSLMGCMGSALNAMEKKEKFDYDAKNIIAFIVLCLEKISATIDESAIAWEKRGYWVKADQFRLEWEWARKCAQVLRIQLVQKDWAEIQTVMDNISTKCKNIAHHKQGKYTLWEGAYSILEHGK